MTNPTNPSVAQRSESYWWSAPIGVGTVETSPVFMGDLPGADPHVVGQLWVNPTGNVVTQSEG
jgi:hypothetical protein